jgi:hypothetical protein
MSTWFPENLIFKNQLKLGHFVFLAFLKITAGDLHALLAVLVLPLVRLGESTAVQFLTPPSSSF